MSSAQRRVLWFIVCLVLLRCAALALGGSALASGPEQAVSAGPRLWISVRAAAPAALMFGLAAGTAFGAWRLSQRRRERLREQRLAREAEAPASGGLRAIAVVDVPGLSRLSCSRRHGAMECLRLYLQTSLEPGERFYRIRQYEYGLCLGFRDREAFERRLQTLEQDVSFLYTAAHPGLNVGARVAGCPLSEAEGAMDALRRSRGQAGGRAQNEHGE